MGTLGRPPGRSDLRIVMKVHGLGKVPLVTTIEPPFGFLSSDAYRKLPVRRILSHGEGDGAHFWGVRDIPASTAASNAAGPSTSTV